MGDRGTFNRSVERIVRPIVEGQIRGFLKEHPRVIDAVDWYKPRSDRTQTFIGSLSKRITRDLTCGITSARLAEALHGTVHCDAPNKVGRGIVACADGTPAGLSTGRGYSPESEAVEGYAPEVFL